MISFVFDRKMNWSFSARISKAMYLDGALFVYRFLRRRNESSRAWIWRSWNFLFMKPLCKSWPLIRFETIREFVAKRPITFQGDGILCLPVFGRGTVCWRGCFVFSEDLNSELVHGLFRTWWYGGHRNDFWLFQGDRVKTTLLIVKKGAELPNSTATVKHFLTVRPKSSRFGFVFHRCFWQGDNYGICIVAWFLVGLISRFLRLFCWFCVFVYSSCLFWHIVVVFGRRIDAGNGSSRIS